MRVRVGRLLLCGGTCFVLSLAGGADAQDIIVESRPEGQNYANYQEIQGSWINSQTPPEASKSAADGLTPSAKCGTRKYLFRPEGQSAGAVEEATARFSPRFQRPGRYYVYVTWPKGANAQPVTYRVKHAAGTDEKKLMQDGQGGAGGSGNANQWILLSDYDFMPGDSQYVELSIGPGCEPVAGHLAGQVYADAVRFSSSPLEKAPVAAGPKRERAPSRTPAPPPVVVRATPPARPASLPSQSESAAPSGTAPVFKWYDAIEPAMEKAAAGNRQLLVFFAAPGTERSDCLEKLLADDIIRRELAWRYIPVKFDFKRDSQLATRLGVFRGGTVMIYNSRGEGKAMITECLQPSELLSRLQ